ncbi:unnamed protein product [Orchesella dallaii]|uniref:Uncharacterized protein n=1 Tax=Orchesella dallaii TaxID=48710 RepID=A0ABP1R4K1_9HEXA
MSDSETALVLTNGGSQSTMPPPVDDPGSTTDGAGLEDAKTTEPEQVVEKLKQKLEFISCLICAEPITPENTQIGWSNTSEEYERMMRVACRLLCVDDNPLLKRWEFGHSDEPKRVFCDECCEVVFDLGSLQSTIDYSRLAINKKLDWIMKTVSESAAKESAGVEKVFFGGKSDVFRSEVLKDDSDGEKKLVKTSTQTDVIGYSGLNYVLTKGALKSFDERPLYSFDGAKMDTDSDHNDDMTFNNNERHEDTSTSSYTPNSEPPMRANVKKTPASATSSSSAKQTTKRGRLTKRPSKYYELGDDKTLQKNKTNKPKRRRQPPAKSSRLDARELVKVEYKSMTGRPKRSTAAKRPNYLVLCEDDDDEYSSQQCSNTGSDYASKNIQIVKDASGKTYFEGVEIVRKQKSIKCENLGCYYVVDGSGYNAFQRIKAHIYENHKGEGTLPAIY